MGNASFGSQREEFDPGDYLAQVVSVKCDDIEDYNDKSKTRPAFIWDVDVQMESGDWVSRKVFTSRVFTDMARVKDPKFVSGLNKLVRACGKVLPQSADAVKGWSEEELIGSQFVWRVEVDEETGAKVRKYLAIKPTAAAPQAAPPAPTAAPRAAAPAPAAAPRTSPRGAVAVADEDPFENQ